MNFKGFNFEYIYWLWGLVLVPFLFYISLHINKKRSFLKKAENFAEAHLLPYLLKKSNFKSDNNFLKIIMCMLIITLMIFALSGPRWGYKDAEIFKENDSLVILLDLSRSMDVEDIKPSRLIRAKEETEDILSFFKGLRVGLIAFASSPHIVTPLTDDLDTIKYFLKSLDTDIIPEQGDKLDKALDAAEQLFDMNKNSGKYILIISDGEIEDFSVSLEKIKSLADKNIFVSSMEIGKKEGAPLVDKDHNLIRESGNIIISKPDTNKLKSFSKAGRGIYLKSHYSNNDTKKLHSFIHLKNKEHDKTEKKIRIWEERFYIPVFLVMFFILNFFRKSYIVFFLSFFLFSGLQDAYALEFKNFFLNKEQIAQKAFNEKDYEKAAENFSDLYNLGVTQYRSGQFSAAEESFSSALKKEPLNSDILYNLGNSLAQQQKFKEALASYKQVLKNDSDNIKAKENIESIEKFLKDQKKEESQGNKDKNNEDQKGEDNDSKDKDNQDQKGEDNDSKDKDNQSQKGQDNDSKGKDNKDQKGEDKDSKDKDSKDQKGEDNDSKGKDSQDQKDQDDNASKDNNNKDQKKDQDKASQDKDSQDKKGQDNDSKDKDNTEKDNEKNKEVNQGDDKESDDNSDSKESELNKENSSKEEDNSDEKNIEEGTENQDDDSESSKNKQRKTQLDIDADQWLNRIRSDHKSLLKKQFYIESQKR